MEGVVYKSSILIKHRQDNKLLYITDTMYTSVTYFASDDFMEEEPDEKELDINCLYRRATFPIDSLRIFH